MLKVVESFTGIGSQKEALDILGIDYEVVATSEWEINAILSYDAMHKTDNVDYSVLVDVDEMNEFIVDKCISRNGKTPMSLADIEKLPIEKTRMVYNSMIRHNNLGSISELNVDEIPDHDFFTYSFPCQDISLAGLQGGLDEDAGTRSSLLWDCRKVIEGKLPKFLMMENVKNLVSKKHRHNFDRWLEWLESQGYTNYWEVVNAKDHGIPQNRERVFVFSIYGAHEPYKFPEGKPLETCLLDFLEKDVDESYDLDEETLGKLVFKDNPNSNNLYIKNATKLGYLEAEHGDAIHLTYLTSKTRRGRVQKGITQTLQTASTIGVLIDGKIRYLTSREYWRLMGFTDEKYDMAAEFVSDNQLYKQAGNSIVVNVLVDLFFNLLKDYKQ